MSRSFPTVTPYLDNDTEGIAPAQDDNFSDDSSIDWRSESSDDDFEETAISTEVEVELCENFSDSDAEEDIIPEEDIVAEQVTALSSGGLSKRDVETTTPGQETSTSDSVNNALFERTDHNTKGSCFNQSVKEFFLRYMYSKSGRSRAFSKEKYDDYCMILRNGCGTKYYSLTKLNRENYLRQCIRISQNYQLFEGKLYAIEENSLIPVVLIEDAINVVDRLHANLAHNGYKETWAAVQKEVYGITEDDVLWLVSRCSTCEPLRANNTRAPLDSIISKFPMERIQMDLMDLSNVPSNGYKWILHLKDHFSKMTWLWPLKSKHSVGIAKCLNSFIRHCGPPKMIQCDNGKEFKGAVKRLLRKRGVNMINGRPRHPQTKGLVVVKGKIKAWKDQNKRTDWDNSLGFIMRSINTSTCKKLPGKLTPHEAMYGHARRPHYDKLRAKFTLTASQVDDAISGRCFVIERYEPPEETNSDSLYNFMA